MAYTFDKANADVASRRDTQYFEMFANRGLYHKGWYACTTPPAGPWLMGLTKLPSIGDYKWELYNIAEDYSQANDLAEEMPDKLRELQELFVVQAAKYDVFPLDNDILQRILAPKPSYVAGRTEFTYTGKLTGIPNSNAPNVLAKSFTITADIEVPDGGGEGVIVTDGGRFGGYGLYLLKGKPVFTYNLLALEKIRWEGPEPLAPGKHTLEFDFKYDGPGMGKGGSGVLKVDGNEVATKSLSGTIPAILTIDETLDIGSDTRTPVDDADYQVPFPFTGTINKVGFKLGPSQLVAAQ
jgi:arylsulfatase